MEEFETIGKNESLQYSGKTTLIASSSGNAKINIGNEISGDRDAFLGLNLYYK